MANILFVEDQPEVIRGIRRILKRRGHDVHVVGNGREAIKQLRTREFDVAVLDIVLPKGIADEIDLEALNQQYTESVAGPLTHEMEERMGMLVLREITNRQIKTPVILLSAYITDAIEKEVEKLKKEGLRCAASFGKPADGLEVVETIEKILSGNANTLSHIN